MIKNSLRRDYQCSLDKSHCSEKVQKVILSTGMSTLSEVEAALAVIAFGFYDGMKLLQLRHLRRLLFLWKDSGY
ncbi:N-acetylneuraminate synthase family protein [Paenibacillus rhizoplanae]